jgi:hypothetical protein
MYYDAGMGFAAIFAPSEPRFTVTRWLLVLAWIMAALWHVGTKPAAADEAALRTGIGRLFEVGWQDAIAARAQADRSYRELLAAAPGDARAEYAYALVLMRQRRYDDAVKTLDALLKTDPAHLAARQNKIRLLMLQKKSSAALAEIDRFSRLVAETDQKQLPPEKRREAIRFLGRLFGFLEGPAVGAAAAATIERTQREAESRLSEQELAIFDEARDGVLVRFEEMTGQSQRGREEALAEKEKQREEARDDLEQQRAQQKERRDELLERGEQLRKEIKDHEAEFTKSERPLLDRLAALEQQAAIPRRERALLLADASNLRAAAARTQNPADRDGLLFRAQQLEVLAARFDVELGVLERQAAALQVERARLLDRFQREVAALAGSLQGIDRELGAQQRNERRFALDEKRLDKPLTGGTRAVRALEAEASAFTTYEPLPLEEERQRLLDSFAKDRP